MLVGTIVPYPQPLSSACCVHPPATPPLKGGAGGVPPFPPKPPLPPNPPPKPKLYCRMIGTLPAACLGTVKLAWMATLIFGKALLSTWPTRVLVTVAMPPLSPSSVFVTSHFTLGTFLGIRP